MSASDAVFVSYAFLVEGLMLANFVVRNLRAEWEQRYGPYLYLFGLSGIAVGLYFIFVGGPWPYVIAPVVYAAWSGWGYRLDVLRRVRWRTSPASWAFASYVGLFLAWQFAFWIPMWYVGMWAWVAFSVMYFASTALNIASHRRRGAGRVVDG